MNTQLTEIAYILDRSGSMATHVEPAIAGFNHFLAEQQRAPGLARLTLVLFDNEYLIHANAVPVAEVVPLDTTTYIPRATTALLDAIGQTIDELGVRLAAMPEPERPGTVIVAIFTDGLENASTRFTSEEISQRIKHQTEKYGWKFFFLGANQDAIATAAKLNIARHNSATYAGDAVGARASQAAFSRKSSALRAQMMPGVSYDECPPDAVVSMGELVAEEDAKQRKQE